MTEGYNGWTNYETWAVKLWIDNEEPTYNYWRRRAQEVDGTLELADMLRNTFRGAAPDLGASVWADLLGSALDNVSWDEIAASMIEEVKE